MRKYYRMCDCDDDWVEYGERFLDEDPAVYMEGEPGMGGYCYVCGMFPWGDAYNDNMMRDLQEMNQ